jgi:hypothetical protein
VTTDQPQPEWLRNLRRDMRLEVRDMAGTGYIPSYYEQLAEPFVTMAAEYIKDAARHPDVYLAPKPEAATPAEEAAR